MIWQVRQTHNFTFILQSLIAFTTLWILEHYSLSESTVSKAVFSVLRFGAVLFQVYAVDAASRLLRGSTCESLVASWPFWQGCPSSVERFLAFSYEVGISQIRYMVMCSGQMYLIFAGMFILQSDSFAMMLVRKNSIKTETYHGVFLWSLLHVAVLVAQTSQMITSPADLTFSQIGSVLFFLYFIPLGVYICRSLGLSKYMCWAGVFVKDFMTVIYPDYDILFFLCMPLVWILLAVVQHSIAGCIFERRIQGVPEFGQAKPLCLKSRDCLGGKMYRLHFDMPVGVSWGVMPGQHIKLHVPNVSKNSKTWNGQGNIEVDTLHISRAYTPVSSADSSILELLIKHYPSNVEKEYPQGGRASKYLTEDLKVGEDIMMSGPYGRRIYFGNGKFEIQVGKPRVTPRVCAVLAGGSGITPALSVMREVQAEAKRKASGTEAWHKHGSEEDIALEYFQVLHANRAEADVLPLTLYECPQEEKMPVPIYIHNLITGQQHENHQTIESAPEDRARPDETGKDVEKYDLSDRRLHFGKLTKEVIAKCFDAPADDVLFLVCGPHGFVNFCEPLLREMGYRHVLLIW
eukprot:TRINITY_DN18028_c0_g1_i2.p1 TRINITY_DN18028_c0_g1~~TRINITY_DN18028_c0_g1_i2.p1  ORF type:complete len:575 (+),score=61.67 TRINITY_DN18028_c0_g1_i2:129-1853(+)